MKIFRLPLLILLSYLFILTGCGQKGPLYLPEKQTPPKIEAKSTSPQIENNVKETDPNKAKQTTKQEASSAEPDGVEK